MYKFCEWVWVWRGTTATTHKLQKKKHFFKAGFLTKTEMKSCFLTLMDIFWLLRVKKHLSTVLHFHSKNRQSVLRTDLFVKHHGKLLVGDAGFGWTGLGRTVWNDVQMYSLKDVFLMTSKQEKSVCSHCCVDPSFQTFKLSIRQFLSICKKSAFAQLWMFFIWKVKVKDIYCHCISKNIHMQWYKIDSGSGEFDWQNPKCTPWFLRI